MHGTTANLGRQPSRPYLELMIRVTTILHAGYCGPCRPWLSLGNQHVASHSTINNVNVATPRDPGSFVSDFAVEFRPWRAWAINPPRRNMLLIVILQAVLM